MNDNVINLSREEMEFAIELASVRACSLAVKPGDKDNWIEAVGGTLPDYICRISKGIMKSGKSRSAAIAIAISRVKAWASGRGDVDADTRAKAAVAVAQWTALKAKAKSKKLIKASYENGEDYLLLSEVDSYSLDQVRQAWDDRFQEARRAYSALNQEAALPYTYVREVWSDYIIVEVESPRRYLKVPYYVEEGEIVFSIPEEVEQQWVSKETEWSNPVGS